VGDVYVWDDTNPAIYRYVPANHQARSLLLHGRMAMAYAVDKSVPTTPPMRRIRFYLLPICDILLVDSATDITYILRMKPLMSVSCCATFFNVPLRPSAVIPQALFGRHFQNTQFSVYYTTNIILIILLFTSLFKKRISLSKPMRAGIFYGQTVIGFFTVGWMGLLKLLCRHSNATVKTEQFVLQRNRLAAFCLLASLIMVTGSRNFGLNVF